MAEAYKWTAPHWAIIVNVGTGRVRRLDIPASKLLEPVGCAGNSAYFIRGTAEVDWKGECELWESNLSKGTERRICMLGKSKDLNLFYGRRVLITGNAHSVLLVRVVGNMQQLGFVDIESGMFREVSHVCKTINDFACNEDGSRVVFLSDSVAYDWRKSLR
jgi:hypothetical protein